jgi:hypothetical protein
MGIKNRSFTNEQFILAVQNCFSKAAVLKSLNLLPAGANYRMFAILTKKLNLDTSHFTGQGHLKGKRHSWSIKIDTQKILVENSTYQGHKLKLRLIEEGIFKNACFICGISEWQGKQLSLHMDHINGNNTDNRLENLRLLCPNCHSLTDTYCGKNKGKSKNKKHVGPETEKIVRQQHTCVDCKRKIDRKATRCKSCAGFLVQSKKIAWPTLSELTAMLDETSYTAVGKQLGVSDNAVRKHTERATKQKERLIENTNNKAEERVCLDLNQDLPS